jgi:putative MATE family efflux protein
MKDLTRGSLLRQLLSLSGMLIINMLAGRFLALVSIYWLGKLGARAQAAATLAITPMMVMLAISPVLSVGARVLIAHAVGGNDRERANRIFNEAFGAALAVAVPVALLVWVNRSGIGTLLTADADTALAIATYLVWIIPSFALQIPIVLMTAALGATGNMRPGTVTQVGSMLVNLAVAPVLAFGWLGLPRLDIAGIGLASFIAAAASTVGLSWYFLNSGSYLRMQPRCWLSRPQTLWTVLKTGLPTGLQSGVSALYMLVVAFLLRPFGPIDQAAFGVGQRLYQVGVMPIVALSGATSVIAGQSFGASRGDRVRECFTTSVALGMVLVPIMWLVVQLIPRSLTGIFSDDPRIVAASADYLRIVSYSWLPVCVLQSCSAVLSGLGNTRASLVIAISYVVIVSGPAWLMSLLPAFRLGWLWELMVAGSVVEMAMGLVFLRAELHKHAPVSSLAARPGRAEAVATDATEDPHPLRELP